MLALRRAKCWFLSAEDSSIDEPCGCMSNAWNAKWAGTVESWIDCIPIHTHIDS